MSLGPGQWTELRGQLVRVACFFVASMMLLIASGADAKLLLIVAVGIVLINGPQLWASTRYGFTGPSVYARSVVSERLPRVVETLAGHRELTGALGLKAASVDRLCRASEAELKTVAEFFRRAGWPRRHEPAQLTVFLLSLGTFILGLVLGAYLPQFDGSDFQKLCHVPVSRALTPTAPVILLACVVLGAALGVRVLNRRRAAAMSANFENAPFADLKRLGEPEYRPQLHALRADLERAALLVDVSEAEAAALQSLGSTEPEDRESFYARIRWSAETDIVIAQVQFVLGLYLGLALPPLLGIGC